VIEPSGVFRMGELPLQVIPTGNEWKVILAGVPVGYEPGLKRLDGSSFRMERGPFSGAVITFDDPESGHAGPIPVVKIDDLYREPPGYGLRPPPDSPDPQRDRAFQDLLDRTPAGGRIKWGLPHPKHEFVRWAQRLDRFIFHSSTNTTIEEFQPKRDSMELADHGGRGNLGAVYGAHDGYWSMFFGIVDRDRLRGSMRNGVTRWESPDGRVTTTYQFSLEQESLASRPFTDGAVYLLPKDCFRRVPFYPDGPPSDEWVSDKPVRPVASLLVIPSDFPFLGQIAGHDETELLSMIDRFREVVSLAMSYEEFGASAIAIKLDWDESKQASYDLWAALAQEYMPVVGHRLDGEGPSRILHLDGPEPYIVQVKKRLDENLSAG
jgi:hypothetical protein